MSQFFNQYNAILEKSLQKVRLRVDPNVKYAEDFAQYDGYVGYILAETDDSFDFFYENSTVTLPKNAIIIEQESTGMRRFMQSAVGNAQGGTSGALGTMVNKAAGLGVGLAGNALKGAANLGSMIYTGQQLFPAGANQNQQPNAAAGAKPVQGAAAAQTTVQPLPANIDRKKSYVVRDTTYKLAAGGQGSRSAGVDFMGGGRPYFITLITAGNVSILPESASELLDKYIQLFVEQTQPMDARNAIMQIQNILKSLPGGTYVNPSGILDPATEQALNTNKNNPGITKIIDQFTRDNAATLKLPPGNQLTPAVLNALKTASNNPTNPTNPTNPAAGKPLTIQKIAQNGNNIYGKLAVITFLDNNDPKKPMMYQDQGILNQAGSDIMLTLLQK